MRGEKIDAVDVYLYALQAKPAIKWYPSTQVPAKCEIWHFPPAPRGNAKCHKYSQGTSDWISWVRAPVCRTAPWIQGRHTCSTRAYIREAAACKSLFPPWTPRLFKDWQHQWLTIRYRSRIRYDTPTAILVVEKICVHELSLGLEYARVVLPYFRANNKYNRTRGVGNYM